MIHIIRKKTQHLKKDWWKTFFTDFRPVFDTIHPATSLAQARHIVRKLGLKKGSSFLDCPCGIGRHSIPLAKMGIKVTGVDITPTYLSEVMEKASALNLDITLVKRDMRSLPFRNQFDAEANMFTSIGYFDEESDNMKVLKQFFRAFDRAANS